MSQIISVSVQNSALQTRVQCVGTIQPVDFAHKRVLTTLWKSAKYGPQQSLFQPQQSLLAKNLFGRHIEFF